MSVDTKRNFQKMVDDGKPVGEVIAVNNFLVEIRGMQPVNLHSLLIFEDGSKGFVNHILEDRVMALHLGAKAVKVGMLV
ncbi:MAG TPA: hypothetical protein VH234_04955, partial [Candidatus Saccharimonadales bacterium]|nr:hypothetical protein [Candidatus Saccharimonadales bacterium]